MAAQAVAACRYPPVGRRGSGANLAKLCWPEGEAYHDSADKNVTVIVIIEEARAVENVEAIAATPGIDFDPVNGKHFVRFCYAGSADEMREAVSRIGDWLKRS